MSKRALYGSMAAALLLSGCAIGPDYVKPDVPVPESFKDANGKAAVQEEWWKAFDDPALSAAVTEALKANNDLKAAQAQVDALLGKFDQAKSYLYPQINGNASLTRKGVDNAVASSPSNLREGVTSTYAASLSLASYEIDLFGKVRRANEAARALLLSSEYTRQALRLSTAAAVAASYLKLSALDGQIALAQENLQASADIEAQSELKYRHGTISESVYLQAKSEVQSARAALSELRGARIAEEAVFNLLCGSNPREVNTTDLEKISLPEVPSALPSTLLQQRPDIASAEQELIAANAQIGIAKAAYFPSIRLTGMLGVQSLDLGDFLSNPTRLWELAPSVSVPVFSAGRIKGEIKTAEADHNRSLARYRQTIIGAFNDTASALGQNTQAKEQLFHQNARAEAIGRAFEQARLRYRIGVISYSDMLLVQQQWLQARQSALIARQNALTASVGLYKALGGGWDGNSSLPPSDYLPAGR